MKYNDIEFNTYFKNYPDSNGFFESFFNGKVVI